MDWLVDAWDWLGTRETELAWIGTLSMLTLIVSFIVVPIVVRRIPHDYFLEDSPATEQLRKRHPGLTLIFLVLKNLIGGILVLGGLIMLFTPGQGLLTIVIGLMLMDFPGKKALEVRLIRIKPLKRGIDWIRKKANKRPLELPET
ncbi:MAG: hypothetical protein WD342_15050 [Verrucomicrobiales bacterium]